MATEIGNSTTPVYVDTRGVPKACSLGLHNKTTVAVENKGTYRVIATISVDGGTPIEIKNFQPPLCTVTFKDEVDSSTIASVKIPVGTDAVPPSPPVHDAKTFNKWDGTYTNVQKDETVWARYTSVTQHTVRFFNFHGASTPFHTVNVNHGAYVGAPTTVLKGWTFDRWNSSVESIPFGNPITQNVDYYGQWIKTYRNLLVETSKTDPTATVAPNKEPTEDCNFSLFSLDTTDAIDLPAGAEIGVAYAKGLLQHDGGSTDHYLKIYPTYASDFGSDAAFSTYSTPSETYTKFIDDRSGSETSSTVKWVMGPSVTDYSSWGEYQPKTEAGVGTIWVTKPRLCISKIAETSSGVQNYTYANCVNHFKVAGSHVFNKVSGTGSSVRNLDFGTYETDFNNRTIPTTNPDGKPINRLCLALIKYTKGCTVKWRNHYLKIVLRLR